MEQSFSQRLAGFLAAAILMPCSVGARAAEITSEPLNKTPGRTFVAISGEITEADVEKFRRIAVKHDHAVVFLASSGGQTLAALEIGRLIRIKEYDTYVSNGAACNSACALIWIAGNKRFLAESARVGFHATYLNNSGRPTESGVGNAVVGSYLSSLNLGRDAIVFATSAPPDKLNWLTVQNAASHGILVSSVGDIDTSDTDTVSSAGDNDTRVYSTSGNWTIGIDQSLNNGCYMLSGYEGVYFRLGIDAREPRDSYAIIAGVNWKSIKVDQEYKVALKFGTEVPWDANATGIVLGDVKGLIIRFDGTDFYKEFAGNSVVAISYRGAEIERLSLAGSSAALAAMVKCQKEQRTKRDPFAR